MKKTTAPENFLHIAGSLSLLALPLCLLIAFVLHFTNFSDFFSFKLVKPPYSPEHLLSTLSSADGGFRNYVLPHLAGYLTLPLFISSALMLAKSTFRFAPWHSLIGATLTCFGAVFLSGVFAAWLSFAAIGNITTESPTNLVTVLEALTNMQGTLLISTALSVFAFIGLIILGFALYHHRDIPRWSSIAFITGNLLILLFMDLDNWMFIGASLMFIGMLPLSIKSLSTLPNAWRSQTHPEQIVNT